MKTTNKKILVVAVALMAVAMLATPIFGTALAGKGQEKLYFKLYVVGLPNYATGERWRTPDPVAGPMQHGRNVEWYPPDVLEVTIGDDTYYPEEVSYSCKICADYNVETFKGIQRITETVTFSCFSEPGTLEISAIGMLGQEGVVFTGHGTGVLEGVKVEGTTWAYTIPWPSPPGFRLAVTREGIVMGWPELNNQIQIETNNNIPFFLFHFQVFFTLQTDVTSMSHLVVVDCFGD